MKDHLTDAVGVFLLTAGLVLGIGVPAMILCAIGMFLEQSFSQ